MVCQCAAGVRMKNTQITKLKSSTSVYNLSKIEKLIRNGKKESKTEKLIFWNEKNGSNGKERK